MHIIYNNSSCYNIKGHYDIQRIEMHRHMTRSCNDRRKVQAYFRAMRFNFALHTRASGISIVRIVTVLWPATTVHSS